MHFAAVSVCDGHQGATACPYGCGYQLQSRTGPIKVFWRAKVAFRRKETGSRGHF